MAHLNVNAIESSLISYLKKEGLYELIPEDRRPLAFDFSHKRKKLIKSEIAFICYYLVVYWVSDTLLVWAARGREFWMFAIFGPSVPLVVLMLVSLALAIVVPRVIVRSKHSEPPELKPTSPGSGPNPSTLFREPILLSFPVLLTILNWYWTSWRIALLYFLLFAPLYLLYPMLYDDDSRNDFLYVLRRPRAYLRLGWITFKPMLKLFIRLAPVLLVIVLFSLFSQELWQSLGSLQTGYLSLGVLIMVLPALIFVFFFPFRNEVNNITNNLPGDKELVQKVYKMLSGQPRNEAFQQLYKDLQWRETAWLMNEILRVVRKKVKIQLVLLLIFTFAFSIVAFFVYFFSLMYVLLSPINLTDWKVDLTTTPAVISLIITQLGLDVRAGPIAKVSLLLSVFIAAMTSVYTLSEAEVKLGIAELLKERVVPWIAVGYVYLNVVSPNYQILECPIKNKRRRLATISILVNRAAHEDVVKEACEHVRERFKRYRTIRLITAYEKAAATSTEEWNSTSKLYTYGMPGKYWQALPIVHEGEQRIIPYPQSAEAHNHTMDISNVAAIPDEWFGNHRVGQDLSRSVWEDNQRVVLHPYAFDAESVLSLIIWLKVRLDSRDHYESFVRNALLKLDTPALLARDAITVHFYTIEDGMELFKFFYSRHLRDVAFKASTDDKIRYKRKQRFLPALA